MKNLGKYRPDLRFRIRFLPARGTQFRKVLPFRKSWIAIAIVSALLVAFSFPLFTLDYSIGDSEDLFDLTSSLFQLFWAMGWIVGVLAIFIVWLLLLFAREILEVSPDGIIQRIEILGIGAEANYPLEYINHLRYCSGRETPGSAWRGNHLVFDYLQVPISFGSALAKDTAKELVSQITAVLRHPIPLGLAKDVELMMEEAGKEARAIQVPEPSVMQTPEEAGQASTLVLVLANAVPLFGILFLDWQVADIMLLFWLESAIVGFFNILKMFYIAGPVAFFYALFFTGHYGAFMAVHLMFIFALFIDSGNASTPLPEVLAIFQGLWVAILALIISHAFSFRVNFIGRQEYQNLSIKDQMQKPYTRIVLMHITLIFGGFMVLALKSTVLPLVLLIVLKIVVDRRAHVREHHDG